MASTYSTDTKLELITTGEKAGQWGGITNTNLQILEQVATGVLDVDMASGSVTLLLTDGATSNGKNQYLRLYGTLTANRTITMPSGSDRVWIMKDDTDRNGTNKYTLGVLTASGTTQTIPVGATVLCRSNGTQTLITILDRGAISINNTYSPYLAVAGDQIFVDTTSAVATVTLPASPAVGDEVTIIDSRNYFGSNAVTVDRSGKPISNGTSNATLNTNAMAATFIYVDATCGWNYKSKAT